MEDGGRSAALVLTSDVGVLAGSVIAECASPTIVIRAAGPGVHRRWWLGSALG